MEPAVFVGFLDGANTSLKQPVELETLEDSTELNIEFVPETLFYNMLSAKAKWLYTLKQWDGVLSEKQRADIKMRGARITWLSARRWGGTIRVLAAQGKNIRTAAEFKGKEQSE